MIGLHFAKPPKPTGTLARLQPYPAKPAEVSAQTVARDAYGDFLIAIFDEWVRHDVGTVHVMNFEWALASWLQLPASVCLFAPRCGRALIVEHNGDVYSCEHFMYEGYRLGAMCNRTIRSS